MGETHVVSALVRKRAELAGEIAAAEKRIAQLRADLGHIDAALRIFDPEYRVQAIRPKRPAPRDEHFAPGELARMTLDTLRTAPEPLKSREIARLIMAARGLDADDAGLLNRVDKSINGYLRRRGAGAGRAGGRGLGRAVAGGGVRVRPAALPQGTGRANLPQVSVEEWL